MADPGERQRATACSHGRRRHIGERAPRPLRGLVRSGPVRRLIIPAWAIDEPIDEAVDPQVESEAPRAF